MSKVAGKVTKVESKGLYIKLENGKEAFLPKENMFIGKKKKLEEIFSVGFVIKAEEKSTKDSLVILTQKELKQAEGDKKKAEKNPKEKYRFNLNTDPRLWAAGKTTTIAAEVSLPSSLRKGKYTLYLHLPDPYPTLYDRPEYSIRLANKDLWDAQTGYNALAVLNIE